MRVLWRGKVKDIKTVWMERKTVRMIDQRHLPEKLHIYIASSVEKVAQAIEKMVVRGAPAIGATAAYGLALADVLGEDVEKSYDRLARTRPTGYDLFYAMDLMMESWRAGMDLLKASSDYAAMLQESCLSIGRHGSRLIKNGSKILTHCNAGALATVDYGTATSPLRVAKSQGKDFYVYVSETRPRLQGSRLTAWEFVQEGIRHSVIADGASGLLLAGGDIDFTIVGADRIAANGDTANKIGTYEKAVLAHENDVPFYVAAPVSTIDFSMKDGDEMPIEHRDEKEVLTIGGVRLAPKESGGLNPAFDVTPARYITGFVTEKGIIAPKQIKSLLKRA